MCPSTLRPDLTRYEAAGVSTPEAVELPPNRAERRRPETHRIVLDASAAAEYKVHVRSVGNWVRAGYVTGYLDAKGRLHVDLDEIEAAFQSNKHMRDGRRSRFGPNARIVTLPVRAEVIRPEGGDR